MQVPTDPTEFWAAFGAIGTLIAAVGTVAAILIAFYQISSERSARRKDERASVTAARISQAQKLSAWIGGSTPVPAIDLEPGDILATLLNASDEPVYQVVVWLVFVQGAAPKTGEEMQAVDPSAARLVSAVPPGAYVVSFSGALGGMHTRPGVELAFSDAAGLHWIRRANGAIEEIVDDPLDHYNISRPVDWQEPSPAG